MLRGHTPYHDEAAGFYHHLSGWFTIVYGPNAGAVPALQGDGLRVDICALLA